jgi:hypothetical protein
MAAHAIEFILPFPPSVNALHFNRKNGKGRGRISTDDYKAWQRDAGWELKNQHVSSIAGRCKITIDLDDNRRGDAANREKAVVDLLVTHGIIQGDSKKYVKRVSIGWEAVKDCRVRVERC